MEAAEGGGGEQVLQHAGSNNCFCRLGWPWVTCTTSTCVEDQVVVKARFFLQLTGHGKCQNGVRQDYSFYYAFFVVCSCFNDVTDRLSIDTMNVILTRCFCVCRQEILSSEMSYGRFLWQLEEVG